MEKNVNLYNAAWHLINASRLLSEHKNEMAEDLLRKASELTNEIDVNDEQIKEIEEYERKLRETP